MSGIVHEEVLQKVDRGTLQYLYFQRNGMNCSSTYLLRWILDLTKPNLIKQTNGKEIPAKKLYTGVHTNNVPGVNHMHRQVS